MAETEDKNEKDFFSSTFYILLENIWAKKEQKTYSGYSSSGGKHFLRGEILVRNMTTIVDITKGTLKLHPYDKGTYYCDCPVANIEPLNDEEAKLLLSFKSNDERYKIFKDNLLDNGKRMTIGCNVFVKVKSVGGGNIVELRGVIRYKGPLPEEDGTMFGVELLDGRGRGTTDGQFRGKRHFQCDPDCGMFVSLEKLRLCKADEEGIFTKLKKKIAESWSNLMSSSAEQANEEKECEKYTMGHKIDDRVWVYINDIPHGGQMKYIGRVPGFDDIHAGIEMDNAVGKGDGEFYGKQLFKCEMNYAHFTPIVNVLSKDQFCQVYDKPDDVPAQSGPASNGKRSLVPETSDDILKMESKFSKQSKDKIINEQEKILKQIKNQQLPEKKALEEIKFNKGGMPHDEVRSNENKSKSHVSRATIEVNKCTKDTTSPTTTFQAGHQNLELGSLVEVTVNQKSRYGVIRWIGCPPNSRIKMAGLELEEDMDGCGDGTIQGVRYFTCPAKRGCLVPLENCLPDSRVTSNVTDSFQRNVSCNGMSQIRINCSTKPDERNNTSMNNSHGTNPPSQNDLSIGSMVEVLSKNAKPRYGVIRWLGILPNSPKMCAGLELEEECDAGTDGTFLGKRYFTCQNRRAFFVHLHNCLPDSRFQRHSIENSNHESKRLVEGDFGGYKSPIIDKDQFIPPPETMDIYLKKEARGIQGHHNSCYLDATLFAAFAFSFVMDSILLRPRNEKDIDEYENVQTVLRNHIIYPLRSNGFVRADRVLELRKLLDKLGTVTGLVGEEKDPEEFLSTLLQQVLKSEPFLKIKLGKETRKEYFYQVLADKDVERVLPSVEELLKKSFHQSDLKLAEVPSCLIVQMPRFGKGFKMYNRILPSMKINIGELVDNTPQDCAVCGKLAKYHCRECFTVTGSDSDSSGNFCMDCNQRVHSHFKRSSHKYQPIMLSRDICSHYANKNVEHREMELFAVICIETSHYVTFAKCQQPDGEVKWCFFDSMSDRKGTKDGYNIPSVTECPEIIEWLSSEKQNRERIINTSDKEMPDRVRRILGDAYVCLYESKEMSMYK